MFARFLFLCILASCAAASTAFAAPEFRRDEQFKPPVLLPNSAVNIATAADSKIIITGGFTNVNGVARTRIARLHPDGELDVDWEANGVTGPAGDPLILRNGQIVVPVALDERRTKLIRLHEDGSIDAGFSAPITTSFYSAPGLSELHELADGRLLFRYLDSAAALRILTLTAAGAEDSVDMSAHFPAVGALTDEYGDAVVASSGVGFVWFERYKANGRLDRNFEITRIPHEVHAFVGDLTGGYFVGANVPGGGSPIFSHIAANGGRASIPPSITGQLKTFFDMAAQMPSSLLISGFIDGPTVIRVAARDQGPSPWIYSHPSEAIGRVGESLRISAQVFGDDLQYQWLRNGVAITAQTNRDLYLPEASLKDNGSYRLAVSNVYGATMSVPIPATIGIFAAGDRDPTFAPKVAGDVSAVAIQKDGKVIAAGAGFIQRFMPDGSTDSSFAAPALSFTPRVIVVADDGRVYAAGVDGAVRLQPNGAIDPAFAPAVTGIHDLIIDRKGRLLVAGRLRYNGRPGAIARLNQDGSVEGSFFFESGDGSKILELSSGKLLLGGDFDHFNGIYSRSLVILESENWYIDTSFSSQMRFRLRPNALTADANGSIIAAGFNTYNESASGLLKLRSSGHVDPAFAPPVEASSAFTFVQQNDGKLVTLGERVLRLNPDGTRDPSFAPAAGSWTIIAAEPSGDLILGGRGAAPLVRIFAEDRGTRLTPIVKHPRPYSTEVLTIPGAEYTLRYASQMSGPWLVVDQAVGTGARIRLQDTTNRGGNQIFYNLQIALPD